MAAVDVVKTSIPHFVAMNDGEVPYIMHDPDLKLAKPRAISRPSQLTSRSRIYVIKNIRSHY